MAVRGIRGATTAEADTEAAILEATQDLLTQIRTVNAVRPEDVAGIWFTTSRDLSAEFPARAARRLGWTEVPMLCGHEMEVPAAIVIGADVEGPRTLEALGLRFDIEPVKLPAAVPAG